MILFFTFFYGKESKHRKPPKKPTGCLCCHACPRRYANKTTGSHLFGVRLRAAKALRFASIKASKLYQSAILNNQLDFSIIYFINCPFDLIPDYLPEQSA
jgi:hypothetical protein